MRNLIKILFATGMLLVFFAYSSEFFSTNASAETYDQMVSRVMAETRVGHPDVWDGCQTECVKQALDQNGWWIVPLATKIHRTPGEVAQYAVTWTFEWGIRFENQHGHAPSAHDWTYAYADNIEQIRANFDVSPMVFAKNEWAEKRYFRANRYFGGPY